jgi:hypothetical protein
MPWNKADETITFECDTCDVVVDCDIKTVRATAQPSDYETDFAVCFRYMRGIGWRSFKRSGRAWSYHCTACGPQAEVEHNDHRRLEDERDRIRSRNAREA